MNLFTHKQTRLFWYAVALSTLLYPIYFWWQYNSVYWLGDFTLWQIQLQSIAKLMALIGITIFFWQFPLASRWPGIERFFGQDTLMKWHHTVGVYGFWIIFLGHALLLDIVYIALGGNWFEYFLPSVSFKTLGQISFALFVAIIIISIWQKKLRIPYHWFKRIHYGMYAAILLGFLHAMYLGSDLVPFGPLRIYYFVWFIIVVIVFIYRVVWIKLRAKQHAYSVSAITPAAENVVSISLKPNDATDNMQYQAGQFTFIQIIDPAVSKEWHPFTISSAPHETATTGEITVTAKGSGDWTLNLQNVLVGSEARIDGPFGTFSLNHHARFSQKHEHVVMIAGGIGITPMRSIIAQAVADKTDVDITLFYAARAEHDLAFIDELYQMAAQHKRITIIPVLAPQRVTAELVQKHIANMDICDWLVCGPPPMMSAIEKMLIDMHVPKRRIQTERFSLK